MGDEIVQLIDAADAVTGEASRGEMRARGLTHRVNYILVFNAAGDLLVQRRTASKDLYPGLLDFAAGGVVCAGEGYAASAARELGEELGVTVPLTAQFNLWFEDATRVPVKRSWGRVFSCVSDGPFTLQKSEVASAEFMTVTDALALATDTVTPDTRQVLAAFLL